MKRITEITKRDIIDLLVNGKEMVFTNFYLPLYGTLDELSFLKRIYNLSELPSYDSRFKDAEGDIIQHTINNYDWEKDWVFKDQRFGLKDGDDEMFLKFICENFHPAVRKEKGQWKEFLADINNLLIQDGYEIYESDTISGRSVYSFRDANAPIKKTSLKKGTILKGLFDNYTISEQFSQGGSARLFDVTDSNGDIQVLKLILSEEKIPSEKIKRFKNELKFLFKQDHPNIVKVTDYGTLDNQKGLFYIMPKYDCDFRSIINSETKYDDLMRYFWQICEGLKYAHNKKCWHRDLKPENILYDRESNSVVVADFGIAHFQENDKDTKINTKESERLANFDYHAPEQRKGNIIDSPSADIWALGLILNEMFTKELAIGIDFKRISDVTSDYGTLDRLVNKMLKARVNERCQNILEVEMLLTSELGNKNTAFYPELLKGILDSLVYPTKEELEMFVNNDNSRINTIKSIENTRNFGLDDEVYPIYISYLTQVIKYIYLTRSGFSEYDAIIKVFVDVIMDDQLPRRPKIFLIFIAGELNKIANYIGSNNNTKIYGEAWDATNTWCTRFKYIPQSNVQEILNVAQNNNYIYLKNLLTNTLEKR